METCTVEPCASAKAFDIVIKGKKIDIGKAEKAFEKIGKVAAATPVVLVGTLNSRPITVYASGRAMIKDVSKKEAEEIGKRLVDVLERNGCII